MKFLATIKSETESYSMMLPTEKDAENWLDIQNCKDKQKMFIDVFDDKWQIIESYEYKKGMKQ